MQTKAIERYFFFGLLFATLIFTFMIFRPFWVVLVLGVSFSIVFHPVYDWLLRRKLPSWLSALLTVILFVILVCGPLLGIGTLVFNQSQDIYQNVVQGGNTGPFIYKIENSINKILPSGINFDASQKVTDFLTSISGNIAKIFSTTLTAFFSFLLVLLSMFYFLKDGTKWRRAVVVLSPLGDKDDEKIIRRLSRAINAVVKGYLLIAVAQGLLMALGLWLFHVPNAALWGVVAGVASLIPSIGTAFVSVPAIIFLYTTGHSAAALGLLIWAAVIVGTVDNFLSPLVISGKTNIPPFLILFSVLGGISIFGPIGILVGPLAISLLYTLISIYRHEFKEEVTP